MAAVARYDSGKATRPLLFLGDIDCTWTNLLVERENRETDPR